MMLKNPKYNLKLHLRMTMCMQAIAHNRKSKMFRGVTQLSPYSTGRIQLSLPKAKQVQARHTP